MAEQTIAEKSEQWRAIAEELYAGAIEGWIKSDTSKVAVDVFSKVVGELLGVAYVAMAPIGIGFAKAMANAEDVVAPAFSEFAAAGVNDVFGTNVSPSQFAASRGGGGRGDAGAALGRALMNQLKGGDGPIAPSDAAAAKYVDAMATMALEDWFKGWFFEVLSSLIPQLDIGKIEAYGALGDKVSNVLGLGRISRQVLSPIVDASIVTPLRWKVDKTYRPSLLSISETARQVARGRWTRDQGIEELARQGYSDERIEAIFNAQRKFFSAGDVRRFVGREYWTNDQGIQHLKDQGYEHQTALDALRLEGLKRIEQLEDAQAARIIAAYANWELDGAAFRGLLNAAISIPAERNLLTLEAETRRELGRPRLTLSQVEAMVKSGVLSVVDYRNRARAFGYPEEDVMALELQLRWELDKNLKAAELRAELEAQRAAEREAKAAAAIARRAELEAQRARDRRGPLSRLERAAVRGIIPLERVGEVLAAEYDADTVAILLDLVESDRAAYLEQQQRADTAGRRAGERGLNVGELRAAVFSNVLTLGEFRSRLEQLGLDAGDAEVLTSTLAAQKADQDAARALRDQASTRAATRSIDLGRYEQLVRRGARTLAQYGALLGDLGFDEPDQVDMIELLQLRIAEDTAARALRDQAAGELEGRGLSLDQFERAVILGVKSIDQYAEFLRAEGFTTDAQIALVALLRDRVAEAEAARARRQASPTPGAGRELSIATVRRAARLGVISPNVYADRLARDGYTLEDIELDVELLLVEIADVQAQRERRDAGDGAGGGRALSLAQLERAVRAQRATLDDYRAQAITLGYDAGDAELLTRLLADELGELRDARDRRDAIAGELAARSLSLPQLEESVLKGFKSLDEFYAELRALGYAADDAELLTNLLAVDLETAAAGAEGVES